jgi:antitoxin component of MazEF toxin-antitoxin module
MLEQIRTVDGESLLPLSADALAAIGLQPGDQVEVTVVGQSLVVQLPPAEKSVESDFVEVFQHVMEKRRDAYQELA